MQDASLMKSLDGDGLRAMLSAGAQVLEVNINALNSLNVFPVPDGDTGTNMLMTLRAIVQETNGIPSSSISAVANAASHGALLGARGNSGVIFSQFVRGLARTLDGHDVADAALLAKAFTDGVTATYRAVSNPVEGTMLTVMRMTAEAMHAANTSPGVLITSMLDIGLIACREAVIQTPSQLPVLKAAGVVDAGGEGFALILDGALRALRGEEISEVLLEFDDSISRIDPSFLESVESEVYGFCTQFIISGESLDPTELRERIDVIANSTVVIGDENLVRIHAHTLEPDALVEMGRSWGIVDQVKIESMDTQHQEFSASHHEDSPPSSSGVVAVVQGAGLEAVFRSLGVGAIVAGGQTMNPSCQELLDAIDTLNAESVLLLPNNSNVLPAANQAADLSTIPVHVVPTTTVPQGITGMLAYSPEAEITDNAEAMTNSVSTLVCGEVVTAVRNAKVDGSSILSGQVMATLEGKLVAISDNPYDALQTLVNEATPEAGALITLYWGGDVTKEKSSNVAEDLLAVHPSTEIEVVYGGQMYYHYLVSIE